MSPLNLIQRNLRVPVEQDICSGCLRAAATALRLPEASVRVVKILSKSLDTGNREQFYYIFSIVTSVPDDFPNPDRLPLYAEQALPAVSIKSCADRPLVVGFGPAGMFAAVELLARGQKPLVFERGKRVEERTLDVRRFMEKRELDEESNI